MNLWSSLNQTGTKGRSFVCYIVHETLLYIYYNISCSLQLLEVTEVDRTEKKRWYWVCFRYEVIGNPEPEGKCLFSVEILVLGSEGAI